MARPHRADQLRRPRKPGRRATAFMVTRPEQPARRHPLPPRPSRHVPFRLTWHLISPASPVRLGDAKPPCRCPHGLEPGIKPAGWSQGHARTAQNTLLCAQKQSSLGGVRNRAERPHMRLATIGRSHASNHVDSCHRITRRGRGWAGSTGVSRKRAALTRPTYGPPTACGPGAGAT